MATLKRQNIQLLFLSLTKTEEYWFKRIMIFVDFLLETSLCARRWNKAYTQSLEEVIVA